MLDGASAASAANEAAPLVAAARSLADSGIGKALPKLREALAGLPARLKAAVIERRNNPDGNSADAATTSLDAIAEALAQDLPGTNWRNGNDGVLDTPWAADADLLPDLLPIAITGAHDGFEGDHRVSTLANASDAQLLALGVGQADVANIRAGLERSPHHAARAIDDAFARLDPNSDTARASQRDLATDSNANSGVTITARLDGSFRVRDADGNEIGTAKDAEGARKLIEAGMLTVDVEVVSSIEISVTPNADEIRAKEEPAHRGGDVAASVERSNTSNSHKVLREHLHKHPDLLNEVTEWHRNFPEWQGIDPDQAKVFYRSKSEVIAIRKMKGEWPGHHPHPLALGGPLGQHLTVTGDTLRKKHPMHVKITTLHSKIIKIIKESNERNDSSSS